MEIVEDLANDLVRLGSVLAVEHRPLVSKFVLLVLPRLKGGRVNDGRLNDFGTGENSPSYGVRSGNGVGTEVARFVDAVVRN
jgi:hypothetical protein